MANKKTVLLIILAFSGAIISCSHHLSSTDEKIEELLSQMTLEEKVGQLNHLKFKYSTDIYNQKVEMRKAIKAGRVGALTPRVSVEELIKWQQFAVDSSRLGIPMLFGSDIIHGYKTIFPIPLGQAASFDMSEIEQAERIAAIEATAMGLNWNFSPMVDVVRDPRWGRCMESAGEDTYLNTRVARARIKGFKGENLALPNTMLTTAKHFAAYGAAEGGREYNTTDVSERVLREVYLPPFKAAVEEGVSSIMHGFNVIDRIPVSAHNFLINDVLKGEWAFEGFTVSDANSFYELIPHGAAASRKEAAMKCINAGADMDLWSQVYWDYLPDLVEEGLVDETLIDASVRRILKAKFDCGIMDNPFLYLNPLLKDSVLMHPKHLEAAERLATKSFVLLKNKHQLLPLDKTESIALAGPLANTAREKALMGAWTIFGKSTDVVTVYDGMKEVMSNVIHLSTGSDDANHMTDDDINAAMAVARSADVVVLALGEYGLHSGEGRSRADISLPGNQEELVKAIAKLNKPIVGLVFSGRPLVLTEVEPYLDAIMLCWQPGTMAGTAIAKVIGGKCSPSGKLPMTLPYHSGQVPIYYNALNTGRPRLGKKDKRWGVSNYLDIPNEPLYPFGFGLTYSEIHYHKLELNDSCLTRGEQLNATISVTNAGDYDIEEVVQCYIQDVSASVARPVKELKAFERITLKIGETKTVAFSITEEDLKYWNSEMKFCADNGEFTLYVGGSSTTNNTATFYLIN